MHRMHVGHWVSPILKEKVDRSKLMKSKTKLMTWDTLPILKILQYVYRDRWSFRTMKDRSHFWRPKAYLLGHGEGSCHPYRQGTQDRYTCEVLTRTILPSTITKCDLIRQTMAQVANSHQLFCYIYLLTW